MTDFYLTFFTNNNITLCNELGTVLSTLRVNLFNPRNQRIR